MDNDLGAKVKKLRISHGLTQEDVAKALDVTPVTLRTDVIL